jgi:hypothetical protein
MTYKLHRGPWDRADGPNPGVVEEIEKEYQREGYPVDSPKYVVIQNRRVDIGNDIYFIEQRNYEFERHIPWSYWHVQGMPQLSCYPTYQEAKAALEEFISAQGHQDNPRA